MTKKKIRAEEGAITPVVTVNNQQIMTNSLNVAAVFEKNHKDVIKAVGNLDIPEEFRRLNFAPTLNRISMPNGGFRNEPAVNLTRDGFTLLAMGFTGPKAMKFKLAYIEAFNKMEEELRRQQEERNRPRIETDQSDPARLAESLMQALIASLSGKHNDKIDDLGVEVVARLRDIATQIAAIPDPTDMQKRMDILAGGFNHMRRHLENMLPKLAIPDDLIYEMRTVSKRLNAIADDQDNRDFAFHERLRALEMRYIGIELKQTATVVGGHRGVQDYIEGNVPESLRDKFNAMRVHKAAGEAMLLRFMKECLMPDPGGKIETQRLYSVYCAWCFANLHTPLRITSYGKLLKGYTPTFDGMMVKIENYVVYLLGAKVRIPSESKTPAAESADVTEGRATL